MEVSYPVAPCQRESKVNGHPLLSGVETKGRGEVKRDHYHAHDHNGSTGEVEVMNQEIPHQPAGQAFQGKGVHPAEMAEHEAEDGGREHQIKENAGHFRTQGAGRPRSQPSPPQRAQHKGDHKGGNPFQLQQDVADRGTDEPDPVVRRPADRAHRVKGWVRRVIRRQGEEKEARGHQQNHAGYFIQATVARRR